jgi:hypothetical protein
MSWFTYGSKDWFRRQRREFSLVDADRWRAPTANRITRKPAMCQLSACAGATNNSSYRDVNVPPTRPTVSILIFAAWRTATSLGHILLSGHPGRRTSAPLAMPLCEAFKSDDRFANLLPLLA